MLIAALAGRAEYAGRLRRKDDAFAAAAFADQKAVARFLQRDPAFATARDAGGLTALQCAAGTRLPGASLEVVQLLLASGAELHAQTKSWLRPVDAASLAASAHNAPVFTFLLEAGADATAALTPALLNGSEELAEIAVRHGAQVDRAVADGQPLLNNLIRWGQFAKARWLLAQGASPNLPDSRGWTAMHQAASRGNEQMVKDLLAAGGDPRQQDKEGCVPRDRATRDKVSVLLSAWRKSSPKVP